MSATKNPPNAQPEQWMDGYLDCFFGSARRSEDPTYKAGYRAAERDRDHARRLGNPWGM